MANKQYFLIDLSEEMQQEVLKIVANSKFWTMYSHYLNQYIDLLKMHGISDERIVAMMYGL